MNYLQDKVKICDIINLMKTKLIYLFAVGLMMIGFNANAAGTLEARARTAETSQEPIPRHEFMSGELKLVEVYINGIKTQYTRDAQIEEGGWFVLSFNASTIHGVGAPNRYSAPVNPGADEESLRIGLIRSTLMAALFEPDALKEYDYFTYLQGTYRTAIVNNRMEFYSRLEDGREVRLVFGR